MGIPLAKIQWACRRGMKELDLFLLPFADNMFYSLTPNQQADFERVLALNDLVLFDCFFNRKKQIDKNLQSMIDMIKSYRLQYVAD